MKVNGNFNKISDTLQKLIKPLKPGEIVTYEMLNGIPNPDPDPAEKSKTPILYGKMQIPTLDRIYDEGANDGNGGYVDIGCVDHFEKDNTPVPRFFYPGMGHNIFSGKFSLYGGKVQDEELYEFFSLCNHNASNTNRDKSVTPLFKVINSIQDSKDATNKFVILKKAITLAADIEEPQARQLAASLNWINYKDWDVLKAEVEKYASRNPDEFIKVYESPNTELKATLKTALDAGIITFDPSTNEVKLGENLLTKLTSGVNLLENIFSWQQSAKNGEQVLATIKKQLEKAEVAA
jgi:hypothetical protein